MFVPVVDWAKPDQRPTYDVFNNLGTQLWFQTDDVEGAIASFENTIEIDEQYATAWCNLGWCHSALGQWQEAIEAFESAKRDGSDNIRRNANAWIGYVRDRTGDTSS